MFKKITISLVTLLATSSLYAKTTLTFYCGSTMSGAMQEISKEFGALNNCDVNIIKGGSGKLWKMLQTKKSGDLFLPGSDSYVKKIEKAGLLESSSKVIGFNQASLIVQKGNPKRVKNLESLVNQNLKVFLCDEKAGSIGANTSKVLKKYKGEDFLDDSYDNTMGMGNDAKSVTKTIASKKADVGITWRATAFWSGNESKVDVIDIDTKYSPKKRLVINLLSFSKNKRLAKKFMNFTSSYKSQAIMKKYGFVK
ncbi:MAG: molybdate ABC transporter substrate-binding protein [Campylobacterota bacterium]|nr:molybdate ABC transporter substrate-binding protein [Campylobacterota bacterium]